MVRDRAQFLAAFVRRPFSTASLTPSSAYLAAAMVQNLALQDASRVVELGPGTGVFTSAIIPCLGSGAELLCLEVNPDLARLVAARFPRARVINDSAENLGSYLERPEDVDCVVSGLPWVILSEGTQRRLLDPVVRALRPAGQFVTFAYSHAAWLPAGRRFRALLDSEFTEVQVSPHVWRNLPPAFVYRCRK